MKTLATLCGLLWVSALLFAQAPESFKYQAVLRDAAGNVKANTAASIQLSILQGSVSGTLVYSETHSVTTNEFGLVNLTVGNGSSKTGTIAAIDWSSNSYFLKVTIDGTDFGTSQLLSVPYALYAKNAANGFSGSYNDLTNKPTFATVATSGSYTDLLNRPTFDGSWTSIAGKPTFASVATTGSYSDLLNKPTLFSGSYTDLTNKPTLFNGIWSSLTGKPTTISGYGITDAFSGNYVDLLNKPTLFSGSYTDLTNKPLLFSGSFADLTSKPTTLTGYGITDAYTKSNLQMSGQALVDAGNITSGIISVDRGGTGTGTLTGVLLGNGTNAFTGVTHSAANQYLRRNSANNAYEFGALANVAGSGNYNDLTNRPTLLDSITFSTATGFQALINNTNTGFSNTANGYQSLNSNTTGSFNTANGYQSLYSNTTGYSNTAHGNGALYNNTTGHNNTAIGADALIWNVVGSNNTVLGSRAGAANRDGSGNVFLGFEAGFWETGSNKLYVANSSTNPPLLFGDFASGRVGIGTTTPDAKLTIGTPGATFNNYGITSDSRIGVVNGSGNRAAMIVQSAGTHGVLTAYNYATNAAMPIVMNPDGGNVGIGTSTPHALLQFPNTVVNRKIVLYESANNDHQYSGFGINTSTLRYQVPATTDNHVFLAAASATGSTELMRINGNGRVGIGTPNPGARFEVAGGDAIINGVTIGMGSGAKFFNTANGHQALFSNTIGEFNTANGYQALYSNADGSGNTANGVAALAYNTMGNSNTATGVYALYSNTTGSNNTANGSQALYSNTTGRDNSANGFKALFSNTTGYENTANGVNALYSNTTGYQNTAYGVSALHFNTTGYFNTAYGVSALSSNTTGTYNTANGVSALFSNTTGSNNTANGFQVLYSNTTGIGNIAYGYRALYSNVANHRSTAIGLNAMYYADNRTIGIATYNTAVGFEALRGSISPANNTGQYNTAVGDQALFSNTSANSNTANGYAALYSNTTGSYNTAIGVNALNSNTTGSYNTANGVLALLSNTTGNYNTAIGREALQLNTTGNNNTAIGYNAGPNINSLFNTTAIGNGAIANSSNQIILGNNQITSLRCNVQTISGLSDKRDKKNINDLSLGLDFLMQLKPRQFNWDRREWYEGNYSDGSLMQSKPTAGFIAQELDEVQTHANAEWLNLVLKDNPEKLEATYGNLLPVMVKAMQEQQQLIEELQQKVETLNSLNVQLKSDHEKRIQKLESQLNAEVKNY